MAHVAVPVLKEKGKDGDASRGEEHERLQVRYKDHLAFRKHQAPWEAMQVYGEFIEVRYGQKPR